MFRLRKAILTDLKDVLQLIQQGRTFLKNSNSLQWQNGYPNQKVVQEDLVNNFTYVLEDSQKIIGTCVFKSSSQVKENYHQLRTGKWLNNTNNFCICQRGVITTKLIGKGLGPKLFQQVQAMAKSMGFKSIRGATYQQNNNTIKLFKKLGYSQCGKLQISLSEKELVGFEKLLINNESI